MDLVFHLEKILNLCSINTRLIQGAPSYYHPGRCGTYIFQKDTHIAYFGEIHPSILSKLGIEGPVVCCELFFDHIPQLFSYKVKKPLTMSQYQATTRDFSFIVNKSISAGNILDTIKKLRINEIKDINIFDVYESESLGHDNKALAFEVLIQSEKATLSEDQLNEISQKIIDAITKNCNGVLRDK